MISLIFELITLIYFPVDPVVIFYREVSYSISYRFLIESGRMEEWYGIRTTLNLGLMIAQKARKQKRKRIRKDITMKTFKVIKDK